jgi:hypothetical protein
MGYVNAAGLFSSDRPDTNIDYIPTAFYIAIMRGDKAASGR